MHLDGIGHDSEGFHKTDFSSFVGLVVTAYWVGSFVCDCKLLACFVVGWLSGMFDLEFEEEPIYSQTGQEDYQYTYYQTNNEWNSVLQCYKSLEFEAEVDCYNRRTRKHYKSREDE